MADVEAANIRFGARQPRIFRVRADLEHLREEEIISRYRLNRVAIHNLVNLLRGDLERQTNRSNSIPVLTQVLVGLRFFAKGDFLSETSDIHGISRSSACNIIERFADAVNTRLTNIRFPNEREMLKIKHQFYRKCQIPNCVGAIDGTLIPIQAPIDHEEIYVCRKNFHAINAQGVVDDKGRFIDAVVKWPGSTHDASIFENSGLKEYLSNQHVGHLLGDSGYGLKKFLLTPVLNPRTNSERNFNNAQSRGRMVVERAFGILKSRFRCLHKTGGCLPLRPGKCCKVITACMRLHNLCLDLNIPLPDPPIVQEEDPHVDLQLNEDGAVGYRNSIIRLFEN